jgi:hypothetical protein
MYRGVLSIYGTYHCPQWGDVGVPGFVPDEVVAGGLGVVTVTGGPVVVVGGIEVVPDDGGFPDPGIPNHARSSSVRTGGVCPTLLQEMPTSFVPSP